MRFVRFLSIFLAIWPSFWLGVGWFWQGKVWLPSDSVLALECAEEMLGKRKAKSESRNKVSKVMDRPTTYETGCWRRHDFNNNEQSFPHRQLLYFFAVHHSLLGIWEIGRLDES
jgi:hypothetical protein